jgi:hypothetical protein
MLYKSRDDRRVDRFAILRMSSGFNEPVLAVNSSSKVAPESPEKGANIRCQCFRLFHRCEVAAARELSPVLDVVAAFDPRTGRKWRFLWKVRDAARYFDPLPRCEMQRSHPGFEVQMARRANGFGHPVKRDIGQQLVPRKTFFKVSVTVGPVSEFFQDPRSQRSGRIVQSVGNGLRGARLHVVVCPRFFQSPVRICEKLLLFST